MEVEEEDRTKGERVAVNFELPNSRQEIIEMSPPPPHPSVKKKKETCSTTSSSPQQQQQGGGQPLPSSSSFFCPFVISTCAQHSTAANPRGGLRRRRRRRNQVCLPRRKREGERVSSGVGRSSNVSLHFGSQEAGLPGDAGCGKPFRA